MLFSSETSPSFAPHLWPPEGSRKAETPPLRLREESSPLVTRRPLLHLPPLLTNHPPSGPHHLFTHPRFHAHYWNCSLANYPHPLPRPLHCFCLAASDPVLSSLSLHSRPFLHTQLCSLASLKVSPRVSDGYPTRCGSLPRHVFFPTFEHIYFALAFTTHFMEKARASGRDTSIIIPAVTPTTFPAVCPGSRWVSLPF